MKNLLLATAIVLASVAGASAADFKNGHENWAWTNAPTKFSEPNYAVLNTKRPTAFEVNQWARSVGGKECLGVHASAYCFGGGASGTN